YAAQDPRALLGMVGASDVQSMAVLEKTPPYLVLSLTLPYVKGMQFLQYWSSAGKSTDAIYASMPESSEQILHPEKYGIDHPVPVTVEDLSPALGTYWKEFDRGRLGEVGVSAFFLPLLQPGPIDASSLASASGTDYLASGWGGDQFAAYENELNHRVL